MEWIYSCVLSLYSRSVCYNLYTRNERKIHLCLRYVHACYIRMLPFMYIHSVSVSPTEGLLYVLLATPLASDEDFFFILYFSSFAVLSFIRILLIAYDYANAYELYRLRPQLDHNSELMPHVWHAQTTLINALDAHSSYLRKKWQWYVIFIILHSDATYTTIHTKAHGYSMLSTCYIKTSDIVRMVHHISGRVS